MRVPPALLLAAALVGTAAARADEPGPEAFLGGWVPPDRFDRLHATTLDLGGGRLEVAFAPGPLGQSRAALLAWTRRSAAAVVSYLGAFPGLRLRLLFVGVPGGEVHGTTWAAPGATTRMLVGRAAPEAEVKASWVLTHELLHSAIPELDDRHLWLAEGLATYVEPIARAQAGDLAVTEVWRWMLEGLPRGLPGPGDQGLDHTHTWGRTYWGGALFCLLAEVELRERSQNRVGLQDALRAVLAAGGNSQARWSVERYLDTADRGVGVPVLRPLYERLKATPAPTDLPALFSRLGVALEGEAVRFDDAAPLAAVRRAITAPRPRAP